MWECKCQCKMNFSCQPSSYKLWIMSQWAHVTIRQEILCRIHRERVGTLRQYINTRRRCRRNVIWKRQDLRVLVIRADANAVNKNTNVYTTSCLLLHAGITLGPQLTWTLLNGYRISCCVPQSPDPIVWTSPGVHVWKHLRSQDTLNAPLLQTLDFIVPWGKLVFTVISVQSTQRDTFQQRQPTFTSYCHKLFICCLMFLSGKSRTKSWSLL